MSKIESLYGTVLQKYPECPRVCFEKAFQCLNSEYQKMFIAEFGHTLEGPRKYKFCKKNSADYNHFWNGCQQLFKNIKRMLSGLLLSEEWLKKYPNCSLPQFRWAYSVLESPYIAIFQKVYGRNLQFGRIVFDMSKNNQNIFRNGKDQLSRNIRVALFNMEVYPTVLEKCPECTEEQFLLACYLLSGKHRLSIGEKDTVLHGKSVFTIETVIKTVKKIIFQEYECVERIKEEVLPNNLMSTFLIRISLKESLPETEEEPEKWRDLGSYFNNVECMKYINSSFLPHQFLLKAKLGYTASGRIYSVEELEEVFEMKPSEITMLLHKMFKDLRNICAQNLKPNILKSR